MIKDFSGEVKHEDSRIRFQKGLVVEECQGNKTIRYEYGELKNGAMVITAKSEQLFAEDIIENTTYFHNEEGFLIQKITTKCKHGVVQSVEVLTCFCGGYNNDRNSHVKTVEGKIVSRVSSSSYLPTEPVKRYGIVDLNSLTVNVSLDKDMMDKAIADAVASIKGGLQ